MHLDYLPSIAKLQPSLVKLVNNGASDNNLSSNKIK